MIEPTESEALPELDRFCEAMLAIREEIRAVERGDWPKDDNPLVNAPHNATDLVRKWEHPYDRGTALFPTEATWGGKFWPFVTRVDNVYGDRNLVCSCPPLSVWMDDEAA
jgi:glycine dehydrogenase